MSTGASGTRKADAEVDGIPRDALLKAYETAVAEYRFNVQLTWDRQKSFLTLEVSAIAAGIALLKLALNTPIICVFLALYFGLLIRLTSFGADVCRRGKIYTRQAQLTMTLAQRELGLFKQLPTFSEPDLHLGLAVTPGQSDYAGAIFKREARRNKDADKGSITSRVSDIFAVLMMIEAAGASLCLYAAVEPAVFAAEGWYAGALKGSWSIVEGVSNVLLFWSRS